MAQGLDGMALRIQKEPRGPSFGSDAPPPSPSSGPDRQGRGVEGLASAFPTTPETFVR